MRKSVTDVCRIWGVAGFLFAGLAAGTSEGAPTADNPETGAEAPSAEEDDRMRERVMRYAVPDGEVTTMIDLGELVAEKRRAVMAHVTQIGPGSRFARIPEEAARELWRHERFRRVVGPFAPKPDGREDDLFAGL